MADLYISGNFDTQGDGDSQGWDASPNAFGMVISGAGINLTRSFSYLNKAGAFAFRPLNEATPKQKIIAGCWFSAANMSDGLPYQRSLGIYSGETLLSSLSIVHNVTTTTKGAGFKRIEVSYTLGASVPANLRMAIHNVAGAPPNASDTHSMLIDNWEVLFEDVKTNTFCMHNGVWKPSEKFVKDNGVWKPAETSVKHSNIWKVV